MFNPLGQNQQPAIQPTMPQIPQMPDVAKAPTKEAIQRVPGILEQIEKELKEWYVDSIEIEVALSPSLKIILKHKGKRSQSPPD
jgi:hypothetical protein